MARDSSNVANSREAIYKWIASIFLLFHVTAVFIAPMAFATQTGPGIASDPVMWAMDLQRPYIDAMFLNHGYAFFAPNPGPSHLVRYRAEFEPGREPLEQVFPDLDRHWPRLLYHRHFMLSEWLYNAYVPVEAPPGLQAGTPEFRDWQNAKDIYQLQWNSFENHLRKKYDARRVNMVRVEHRQPDPYEFFFQKMAIDDPTLYRDLPEVVTETQR